MYSIESDIHVTVENIPDFQKSFLAETQTILKVLEKLLGKNGLTGPERIKSTFSV